VSGSGSSWAVCKSPPRSRQITMPAPHRSVFFIGRMPFLPPKQQCQSTEGKKTSINAGSTNSLTFLTTDASYSLIFATKQLNTNATFLTSVWNDNSHLTECLKNKSNHWTTAMYKHKVQLLQFSTTHIFPRSSLIFCHIRHIFMTHLPNILKFFRKVEHIYNATFLESTINKTSHPNSH